MARRKGWNKEERLEKERLAKLHMLPLSAYKVGDVVLLMYCKKWWPAQVHGMVDDGNLHVVFCGFDFE